MSAVQNFIIHQGETWTRQITWKTGDPALPVDLTSATAVMKIRTTAESPTVVAEPTISLGGVAGTINLSLTSAQTTDMILKGAKTGSLSEDGSVEHKGLLGVYDLKVTISGVSTILLTGQICFVLEVSR